MLLAWLNRADDASIATDSELASLPATNVQQPIVAQQWQTAAGVTAAYLLLDMGASVSCALLALLGTNFTSAATVRLRGSVTDPTATGSLAIDTGVLASGAKDGYGAVYKAFAATAARYWRLDVEDTTVDDNLAVGRLFLGPSWEPAINMLIGWGNTTRDPSSRGRSRGGQVYPDTQPQQRVLEFTLDMATEAEAYANAYAMARHAGVTTDVLAIPDIDGAYLSEHAVWGLLEASTPINEPQLGVYRQKYTIEERL